MDNSLLHKVALTFLPGIGNINAKKIIAYSGNINSIFKQSKSINNKVPGISKTALDEIEKKIAIEKAEKELLFLKKYGIKTHFYLDSDYPELLKSCNDSPVLLYKLGDIDLNKGKYLSVIGTRKASEYGKKVCKKIIEDLAVSNPDVIIVSGLAYGIDITAHKVALDCGLKTIAVLGHGLDLVYPASHKKYATAIIKNGALLTEFNSNSSRDAGNFVRRNRIVAGISEATLVIESAVKGGALITAEIANTYNREVLAVPGNIGEEMSQGCNFLIKTLRASMVENANDIVNQLNWEKNKNLIVQKKIEFSLNDIESKVYEYIKGNKLSNIDVIANQLNIPIYELSAILLNVEFLGLIKCYPGKLFSAI